MNAPSQAFAEMLRAKTAASAKAATESAQPDPDEDRVSFDDEIEEEVAQASAEQKTKSAEQAKTATNNAISALAVYENQFSEFVLHVSMGGRMEVIQLDSSLASDFLSKLVRENTNKLPTKQGLEELRTVLRILAREKRARIITAYRVAKHRSGYALDLGDKCVLITSQDCTIEINASIPFVRGRGYGTLPDPIFPGTARAALEILLKWAINELGIPKRCAPLFVVALVECLRVGTAYVVLSFYGPPGSGKSVAARLTTLLIDPTESGALPNIKMDADSIAAAAQHRHVLTFDNLSRLSAADQDLFCTCSTGGEIMVRKLYSNGDTAILPIHRPVVITSVQPVVTRPDLLSRTLPIEFSPRTGGSRKSEADLIEKFMEQRPTLLGALCVLLSAGMSNY